ncbi:MAG TPA: hypothetical protein VGM39_14050 [Kofleriaceae bacterium]|jgi:multisubunit Na+/H+ antiporter MnhG subunit
MPEPKRPMPNVLYSKMFIIGMVIVSSGQIAMLRATEGPSIEARTERATVGVITLIGVILVIAGFWRWYRQRDRK